MKIILNTATMKHLLILILLCVSVSLCAQDNKQQTTKQQTTQVSTKKTQQNVEYVYICNGPSSKKYHKTSNCRGLSNCSTAKQKLSKADAVKKGRTACKICYK